MMESPLDGKCWITSGSFSVAKQAKAAEVSAKHRESKPKSKSEVEAVSMTKAKWVVSEPETAVNCTVHCGAHNESCAEREAETDERTQNVMANAVMNGVFMWGRVQQLKYRFFDIVYIAEAPTPMGRRFQFLAGIRGQ